MKEIELLVKRESALSKQSLLFQLLGKFGDDLPESIQIDIMSMAEEEWIIYNELTNNLVKLLK